MSNKSKTKNEEIEGFQILDGSITNAYQQLACAIVIRATKDYQHALLRPDNSWEVVLAQDLSDIAGAAQTAIKKRLRQDPSSVEECKRFLCWVIEDCLPRSKNASWRKNVETSIKYIEKAQTAEEMIDATHRYRMACSFYSKWTGVIEERRLAELKNLRKFLSDGRVEFYSNGRLDSEALRKLIEDKAEKERQRRERKRKREQGADNQ